LPISHFRGPSPSQGFFFRRWRSIRRRSSVRRSTCSNRCDIEPISIETNPSSNSNMESVFHSEPFAGNPGWNVEGTKVIPHETNARNPRVAARA